MMQVEIDGVEVEVKESINVQVRLPGATDEEDQTVNLRVTEEGVIIDTWDAKQEEVLESIGHEWSDYYVMPAEDDDGDDYCECGRNMTRGDLHTADCEIALQQDIEDGSV